MQLAMIQDKIVPLDKLDPVYFDRGMLFGDGVYEVVRSYNGRIFALDEHLQRFAKSLAAIAIEGIDTGEIRRRVLRAFEAAGITEAKIYFHITRGSAARSHTWDAELKPNFFMTVTKLPDNSKDKAGGIAVSTHPDWRWKRCDIKSLNLLPNVLARQDAVRKGCTEAILVDENGLITEGAASAFFAIFDSTVQTVPLTANILPSITRNFVLKAAGNIGLKTLEESITVERAGSADEAFIAVTTQDIIPVVRFDEAVIGDGGAGKHTKELMKEFQKFVK